MFTGNAYAPTSRACRTTLRDARRALRRLGRSRAAPSAAGSSTTTQQRPPRARGLRRRDHRLGARPGVRDDCEQNDIQAPHRAHYLQAARARPESGTRPPHTWRRVLRAVQQAGGHPGAAAADPIGGGAGSPTACSTGSTGSSSPAEPTSTRPRDAAAAHPRRTEPAWPERDAFEEDAARGRSRPRAAASRHLPRHATAQRRAAAAPSHQHLPDLVGATTYHARATAPSRPATGRGRTPARLARVAARCGPIEPCKSFHHQRGRRRLGDGPRGDTGCAARTSPVAGDRAAGVPFGVGRAVAPRGGRGRGRPPLRRASSRPRGVPSRRNGKRQAVP